MVDSEGGAVATARVWRLVVIGASAGGLQALRPIVAGLIADGRTAYVLAHHKSPTAHSKLVDLLARLGPLRILSASDGAALRPDHFYICPPNAEIEIHQGALTVLPRDPDQSISPSIDRLFETAAESGAPELVAIVLSGSGSDGLRGIGAVRQAGGTVVAQQPDSATQPILPRAAIDTGQVDLVGTCEQIARWLTGDHVESLAPAEGLVSPADQPVMSQILQIVTQEVQVDLGRYKLTTLTRQTLRRSLMLGLPSLQAYLELLRGDIDEVRRLFKAFLISVSEFFRNPEAFDALKMALSPLVEVRRAGESIRAWVPGCATGQEAYSVAITIAELLGGRLGQIEVRVFATDVDRGALDFARAGCYVEAALSEMPSRLRERWFTRTSDGWRVSQPLRDLCVFSEHNVIAHPPFIRMDLISCRNLLIYLQPSLQRDLIQIFHYSLRPSGLLLLGHSESPVGGEQHFTTVDLVGRLFRRKEGSTAHLPRRGLSGSAASAFLPRRSPAGGESSRRSQADQALIAIARRFGPTAVLIRQDFEPMQFLGDAQRYFGLPDESLELTVFALCRPELRAELKTLCYRVTQEALDTLGGLPVRLQLEDGLHSVRPVIHRLDIRSGDASEALLLVCFEDLGAPADAMPAVASSDPAADALAFSQKELARLRTEVADTREHLQAAIEQLESTNEELQALNEEVQSSTEEVQSANEELQASNEELTTLNDELRQKSLEASELSTTLSNIQDSISASLVVVDQEGRIMRFNALATRVFGVVVRDIGSLLYGVPCHLQLPNLRAQVAAVAAGGPTLIERVHQGHFHYLMQIDPYRDPMGACVGAVLTFLDISELHRVEMAQQSSELRFRRIWESTLEGLLVCDAQGLIADANPALEAMFGYGCGELVGRPVAALVPAELRSAHDGYMAGFLRKPDGRRMAPMRDLSGCRKDGSLLPIEASLSSMEVDGETFALAAVSDISARRRAELALYEHRAQLEELVARRTFEVSELYNSAPCGYHSLDADAMFISINDTALTWLGYAREEVVGRLRATDLLAPHSRPVFQTNFQRFMRQGRLEGMELDFTRKDGTLLPIVLDASAKYDAHGRFVSSRSTMFDATAMRRAERELVLAREAAEAASLAKTTFLASMSHEIRTPLNAILGMCQLLQRDGVSPDQGPRLDRIDQAGRHLLDVINNVLELSKIEAGRVELHGQDFDLRGLVEKVLAVAAGLAEAKGLALQTELDEEPRWLHGDETLLRQALLNYVGNAVKFTAAGAITIRVRTEAEAEDRMLVRFEVIDSGPGLSAAEQRRLFKPFEQGADNQAASQAGTGLGLVITQRLARLMGGDCGVISAPGQGSTFWFTARLAKSVGPAREPGVPSPVGVDVESELSRRHAGARVLLAEDNVVNQEVALALLADVGLAVDVAANGREAVGKAVSNDYELILMDMQMPMMGGIDASREIRRLRGRHPPIVALTANAFSEDREACLRAGMNDFLSKPVDPQDLFATVLRWLSIGYAK